jgi:ubiquinone/menaquinone biosynthesis C-methylase UbiE
LTELPSGPPEGDAQGDMQVDAQFDAYADSYDETVNQSLAFLGVKVGYFTRVKADYLLDLLADHFGDTRGLDLLDVGCGVGNYHRLVQGRLRSLSGVDVSAACVDEAAQHNPAGTYCAYDGSRLPFADGQFDVATTICVMHHVPPAQWPAFVAEMKRVLKPGGLAVVFEHNPLNPLTRRVVSNCEFDADAVLLRQGRTRSLLAEAGFRDVASRSILSIPSAGQWSRRLDLLLGRLALGAQYFARGTA